MQGGRKSSSRGRQQLQNQTREQKNKLWGEEANRSLRGAMDLTFRGGGGGRREALDKGNGRGLECPGNVWLVLGKEEELAGESLSGRCVWMENRRGEYAMLRSSSGLDLGCAVRLRLWLPAKNRRR